MEKHGLDGQGNRLFFTVNAWADRSPATYAVAESYVYDLDASVTVTSTYTQHAFIAKRVGFKSSGIDDFRRDLIAFFSELGLEGLKVEGETIHGLRPRTGDDDWLTLYNWVKENGEKV